MDSCTWRWPLPQYPHGCREYKVFRWTAVPEDDHYPNILVGAKSTKCLGGQLYLKMTATPISSWVQRVQSVQVDSCTWRWPLPQYPRGSKKYKVSRWTAVPEDDRYSNILVGAKNTKCSGEQKYLKMTATPISSWVQRYSWNSMPVQWKLCNF